jgi:ubiquinone/menaquinone biosynthesis C-methylase UbiE
MPEHQSDPSSALTKMRGLIFGFCISRSIATVAELEIADRLASGPRTAAELANECGVQERPLFRVLRALAGEGIFIEGDDGRFGLTPAADLLRSDHPSSLRDWAIYVTDLTFRASFEMLHTVRTGELAFPKIFGVGLFEYLAQHPDYSERLLRAMSSINVARTTGLVETYDFGQANWLVDVGGAHGTMAVAIAQRYPRLRCTTFDRPSAEQGAQKTFADHTVGDRCDFVGGDFFHDDVPAGADTYLLSAVLHDWDDARCQQILRNCRRAVSETGRLLVVDIVLSDERNTPDTYRNCLDLAVMLQLGGMERTEAEFRDLLTSAGFNLRQVLTMNAPQSVLVAVPE